MDRSLHLPLDFDRRESLRILHRKLAEAHEAPHTRTDEQNYTSLIALRIWLDWGSSGAEFRPLRFITSVEGPFDWSREDLAYIIEGGAKWMGPPGMLMQATVDAGFIKVEKRDGNLGLVLDGFYPLNAHLSPDYMSIQKRGGHAAAARRLAKQSGMEAAQRRELFEQQGRLPFGAETATPAEQESAYALFIRLYRVCGLNAPLAEQFTETAMKDALGIVRKFTADQILDVETFILANRDNPEVVKVPEKILVNFAAYIDNAAKMT